MSIVLYSFGYLGIHLTICMIVKYIIRHISLNACFRKKSYCVDNEICNEIKLDSTDLQNVLIQCQRNKRLPGIDRPTKELSSQISPSDFHSVSLCLSFALISSPYFYPLQS